jgi:hypothetical protein
MRQPEFKKLYQSERRAVVEAAITELQNLCKDAVDVLSRNLHCENPHAEIRAASTILKLAITSMEMSDITERLEQLEAAAGADNNGMSLR